MHYFGELYMRRLLRALRGLSSTPAVKNSGLAKRRRAIRTAADLSLALTAQGSAWSRALMKNILSGHAEDEILTTKSVAGRRKKSASPSPTGQPRSNDGDFGHNYATGSRAPRQSVLQQLRGARGSFRRLGWCRPRICRRRNIVSAALPASAVARMLVSRRTKLLRSLIPGGKSMDYRCLLTEAADYIVSLKTQVEVMQLLANARSASAPSII